MAENPGHPSALAFLQELECTGAAKVSSLVAQSPSPSQPSIEESTPQSEPVDTTPVREVVADRALLEHQTATAANRHDWRQVVRLAEELLSMDRKIEYSCWLIRAQVELGLFGSAESNLKQIVQTTPAGASLDPTLRKLLTDLRLRIAARRSTERYIVTSWLPLTEETVWLVMEGPAREVARFKSEEAAKRFLATEASRA